MGTFGADANGEATSGMSHEGEGNARSSVESNGSRVTPLYDAFLLLTTAALDGFRVFNSSMRTGINL
jgi:hypothetical protein